MIQIEKIQPTDFATVKKLIIQAFTESQHGYGGEAELVERIRLESNYQPALELVAKDYLQKICGHGLLSEIKIVHENQQVTGVALAPLSVLPEMQQQGIGGKLLRALEKQAQQLNYPFLSILGNPDYYGKFGYSPAQKFQISAPFPVPTEAYLIKELTPEGLKNVQGVVNYLDAFNE